MTTSLLLDLNKLAPMPSASEENWRRTNPELFFLPQDEILNFQGQSAFENKNNLTPWKVCFRNLENMEQVFSTLEKVCAKDGVECLEQNKHRLVLIHIQDGIADVYQSDALKSTFEFKSAPWEPRSIVDRSKIGEALTSRLKYSSPHKLCVTLATQNNEVPLVVILNNLDPNFSQSYGHVHFTLKQNSKCELMLFEGGSSFSLFRHHLELEKNTVLTQVWTCGVSASAKTAYIERLVTLNENAKFKDAQIFLPITNMRINSHIDYLEKNASSQSSGVVIANAGKFDYEPIQEHHASFCKSSLHLKVIADKKARVAFQGLIKAHKDAQKCEALQENKNILISPLARIDSQPRLEILPHDIMCKHGSATAEIDKKQLYYLQSRGFDATQARRLILNSFAQSALGHLEAESTLAQLAQCALDLSLAHATL